MRSDTNRTGHYLDYDEYAQGEMGAQKAWECSENAEDSAGYAVEFLEMKHIDHGLTSQIVYQEGVIDTFFFDFVMKYQDTPAHSPETVVCSLKVMVQDTLGNYIPLILHPEDGANYNTILTVGTLVDNSIFPEYTYYRFYKHWDEFLQEGVRIESGKIYSLYFQIYWNGVGDLYIDGMQIEDNFYRKLKNGEYDTVITGRMNDFTGYDNINHFYGYDEPQPPQFESFREIKKLLYKNNRTY